MRLSWEEIYLHCDLITKQNTERETEIKTAIII